MVPLVTVESRWMFALKIAGVIVLTNALGWAIYVRRHRTGIMKDCAAAKGLPQ
jgi:hypothetical protein